jgi:hypothetical protein
MRGRVKFDGTVLCEPGPVLRGELETGYLPAGSEGGVEAYAGKLRRLYTAVLSFGDHQIARWDVTDQRTKFEEQPGDYWSEEQREQAEEAFVEAFIGDKLAAIFGALEGVIKE